MGVLLEEKGDNRLTLGARCLVGRASHCDLQLVDSCVSGEHATLRWVDDAWRLRDLGSRNGTLVDDHPVSPGEEVGLRKGQVLCFGSRAVRWTLADGSAPVVRARLSGADEVREVDGGLLALPSSKRPECVIYADDRGRWILEHDDDRREVRDQSQIELRDGTWVLEVPQRPDPVETTRAVTTSPRLVSQIRLDFEVSKDGEYVALTLHDDGWTADLSGRAYNEVLLLLARARLDDVEEGDADSADRGWLYAEDLCRM
ncbi:MAG: FHA domain-containing protein, partial [Myxococcales bacterium]|nr:FHA domain-containing protein [Myxococcales bacterium]